MEYSEPAAGDRDLLRRALERDDPRDISGQIVALALNDPDWEWLQEKCLELTGHDNPEVRGVAATCLGHIARIHRRLDRDRVVAALQAMVHDSAAGGRAEDALDDIEVFIPR